MSKERKGKRERKMTPSCSVLSVRIPPWSAGAVNQFCKACKEPVKLTPDQTFVSLFVCFRSQCYKPHLSKTPPLIELSTVSFGVDISSAVLLKRRGLPSLPPKKPPIFISRWSYWITRKVHFFNVLRFQRQIYVCICLHFLSVTQPSSPSRNCLAEPVTFTLCPENTSVHCFSPNKKK